MASRERLPLELKTVRGEIDARYFPIGLRSALYSFDTLRQSNPYDLAEQIARTGDVGPHLRQLARGVRRLTFRGVLAVASRHSGVCPVYVRGKMDTFTSLNGLFWWDDGTGETRRRLLALAWAKGGRA